MPNEYSIAVLLPTRNRTKALTTSVTSIIQNANQPDQIQLLFGFDNDDEIGLAHFTEVIQPWLDQRDVAYEAQAFDSMGYAGLNRYYNTLAKSADADWLFVWNDDAVMDTTGWDAEIRRYTGQFRLLKVHTHNEHPYSIFPVAPRAWFDYLGHLSRHQMIDAEMSQTAFMLDLMQVIDVHVTHNQVELTKDSTDPLKPKIRFEGDPNNPYDFHHYAIVNQRTADCERLSQLVASLGIDITFWQNVKANKQDPWQRLKELDINHHMHNFTTEYDSDGKVKSIVYEKN
jgi:hypothetical protein